ncbi:MAG: prepilin peptidase [bacterium]
MEYNIYTIFGDFFYLIIFTLGLCLGSFLNSWIWRKHENIMVSRGRSMCANCRRKLKWYENIPVLSCIYLGGKCKTCKSIIPKHFIWVELSTAILFLFITYYRLEFTDFNSIIYHRDIVLIGFLLVIFLYDFLYKIVLSEIVWICSLAGLYFHFLSKDLSITSMVLGVLIAGGFFFVQYVISKGKWIGGGDVRLGVMMGIWLGWPYILVGLFTAYVSGAIVGTILLIFKKKKMSSEIPFGTFLSASTFFALVYGYEVVQFYFGLIR